MTETTSSVRKRVDPETKKYNLKSMLEDGVKVTDMAFKFEIGSSTIHRWLKEYRDAKEESLLRYITTNEMKKIQDEYERKLRDLQEGNEILKKPCTFARKTEHNFCIH